MSAMLIADLGTESQLFLDDEMIKTLNLENLNRWYSNMSKDPVIQSSFSSLEEEITLMKDGLKFERMMTTDGSKKDR